MIIMPYVNDDALNLASDLTIIACKGIDAPYPDVEDGLRAAGAGDMLYR